MNKPFPDVCTCGSGASYATCCGRFIDAGEQPATAEELMRSRYSAYVLSRWDYLSATWHPTTRRQNLENDRDEMVTWLGLDIKRTASGGPDDQEGQVEFVARYKLEGRAHRLHEISRFLRRKGRWYYVDGEPGPTSR